MPTGVRMPVLSMSMRLRMGMVQELEMPGIFRAASISLMSFSGVIPGRHSLSGLSTMVFSIMVSGAGSVGVRARPALPKTDSTSGNCMTILSWSWSTRPASAIDMPGKPVGM